MNTVAESVERRTPVPEPVERRSPVPEPVEGRRLVPELVEGLKIRTGYDEFILGWFARIAHRPGVNQAELVGATAARSEL